MMNRNLKPEYINKIRAIEPPNGYKFDIANYLYNPAYGYDYPAFIKLISEDGEKQIYRRIYYFKYYNGTGEYRRETFTRIKNGGAWQVVNGSKEYSDEVIETANRFNIKKLLTFCN